MAKGSIAKVNVENKIREIFGADFVGILDKKIYVYADDGGEKVQIAISLTCPKTPVLESNKMSYNQGIDFTNEDVIVPNSQVSEISEDEQNNIRELMKRMGL